MKLSGEKQKDFDLPEPDLTYTRQVTKSQDRLRKRQMMAEKYKSVLNDPLARQKVRPPPQKFDIEEVEEANQAQPQLLEVPPPEKDKSPGHLSQRSEEEFDLNRE